MVYRKLSNRILSFVLAFAMIVTPMLSTLEPVVAESEEGPSKTEYAFEDDALKAKAVLSKAEAIPDDAEFTVTPVTKKSKGYNYEAYMDALNKGANAEYNSGNTLLYDFAFIKDGVEIEPEEGTVKVSVEFKDNQLSEMLGAESTTDVIVTHLPLKDAVREPYDTTKNATEISVSDVKTESLNDVTVKLQAKEQIDFSLSSLSVVGIKAKAKTLAAEGDTYTVNMSFKGYDGETIEYDGTDQFYAYVELRDKSTNEIVGWNAKPISTSDPSVEFDVFGTLDNEYMIETWDQTHIVFYDSDLHTVSTRIYTANPEPTYHNVCNPGQYDQLPVDTFNGYNVVSNTPDPSTSTTNVVMQKAYDKEFAVNIHFSPELSTEIKDSDYYYVLVDVDHVTTGHTYYLQRFNTDSVSAGAEHELLEVLQWYDNNGNEKPNEKFTGNEKSVNVYILKATRELNYNDAIARTNCTVVAEGGAVKDYSVTYDTDWEDGIPTPIHDVDRHIDEYDFDIILSKIDATNDYNFKSVLGPGLYYGITAETFDQGNHIQSNFATNYYDGHENIVEADLASAAGAIVMSDAKDYEGKLIDIGQSHSGNVLLYTNGNEDCLKNSRDFVTVITKDTSELKTNFVDPIINYGATISNEMIQHPATFNLPTGTDKIELNTTGFPDDATIYIDGDKIKDYLKEGKLLITKHPDQVLVFNFDETTELILGEYMVKYPDMSEYSDVDLMDGYIKTDTPTSKGPKNDAIDELAQHIVWNCNSVTNLTLGMTTGMYLVPSVESYTETAQTSSGWIITGGTFHNSGGEWHSVYSELPDIDKANLNAKKSLDGKAPSMSQVFEFKIEKYDPTNEEWVVKETVENNGGAINYSDNGLTDGWNVYRLTETKKSDSTEGNYTIDSTVFYTAVDYQTYGSGGSTMKVASLPRYFGTFEESEFSADENKDYSEIGLSNPITELPPTFHNSTSSDKEATGSATFSANKTFTNGTLEAGMFEFELCDSEGKVLQTKPANALGKVQFDAIIYVKNATTDQTGTYNYIIREKLPALVDIDHPTLNGITYDTTEHPVTVVVSDSGDTLAVTYNGSNTFATPEFTNTKNIDVDREDTEIEINKQDQDEEPLDGATFKLYDGSEEVAEYTGGTFKIRTDDAKLAGKLPAVGETKTLTLKETEAPAGYQLDDTEYDVTIAATSREELKDGTYVTITSYEIKINGKTSADITNTKKTDTDRKDSEITINKQDQDEEPLDGATFKLYDGSEEVAEYTGGTFKIRTDDAKLGDFLPKEDGGEVTLHLKETKAPKGYKMDTNDHPVVIRTSITEAYDKDKDAFVTTTKYTMTIDGKSEIDITNAEKTDRDRVDDSVTVKKIDDITGQEITGAIFKLYKDEACTEEIKSYQGGTFEVSTADTQLGNYLPIPDDDSVTLYLKETKAPAGYKLYDHVYRIVITAHDSTEYDSEIDANVTTTTYTMKIDGEDTFSIPNTEKHGESIKDDSVTITKKDQDGKLLSGAEFTIYSDAECTNVLDERAGDEFLISTEDDNLQDILPAADSQVTIYLKETKAPDGYDMDKTVHPIVIRASESKAYDATEDKYITTKTYSMTIDGESEIDITNTKKTGEKTKHASVVISKKDASDNSDLEGATFGLYTDEDALNKIAEYEGGEFEISTEDDELAQYLPKGEENPVTLYLKETQAPDGYYPDFTPHPVTISKTVTTGYDSEEDAYVTVTEYSMTIDDKSTRDIANMRNVTDEVIDDKVEITKKDQDGEELSGATFGLYDNNDREITTFNDTSFQITSNYLIDTLVGTDEHMNDGDEITFKLKELEAPQGYDIDKEEHIITLKLDVTPQRLVPEKKAFVTTYKYTLKIDGKSEIDIINTKKTDTETKHDDITITKKDQDGEVLEGAEFKLYADEAGEAEINTYTDSKFTISTEDELLGDFLPAEDGGEVTLHLKETKAPEGYEMDTADHKVVISTSISEAYDEEKDAFVTTTKYSMTIDEKSEIDITNTKKTGEETKHDNITITKKDQDGEVLEGAEFKLYADEAGETEINTYTDSKFTISTEDELLGDFLPAEDGGEVTLHLKETKAPEGYEMDTADHKVVISTSISEAYDEEKDAFVTTTKYSMTIDEKSEIDIINTKDKDEEDDEEDEDEESKKTKKKERKETEDDEDTAGKLVKTGDSSDLLIPILILLIACQLLILTVIGYSRYRKDRE